MQTFLPYSDFKKSAQVLDRQRLGKQRVEAYQILLSLTNPDYGWKNHPAVKMWKGYENALIEYGIAICDEWIKRGYKDTIREKLRSKYPWHQIAPRPTWLGNKKFHASHRSNLLRKKLDWYSQFRWLESPTLEYYWPNNLDIK